MTTKTPEAEPEAEISDFEPLTPEEAQRLREQNPELSPWWVIGAQVALGVIVAGVAWVWTGLSSAAVSALYGAMAVAVPAALFVRGVRRGTGAVSQSAAMLRFFVWESIKIVRRGHAGRGTVAGRRAELAGAGRWRDRRPEDVLDRARGAAQVVEPDLTV